MAAFPCFQEAEIQVHCSPPCHPHLSTAECGQQSHHLHARPPAHGKPTLSHPVITLPAEVGPSQLPNMWMAVGFGYGIGERRVGGGSCNDCTQCMAVVWASTSPTGSVTARRHMSS